MLVQHFSLTSHDTNKTSKEIRAAGDLGMIEMTQRQVVRGRVVAHRLHHVVALAELRGRCGAEFFQATAVRVKRLRPGWVRR